jgi:hypothetical protein
MAPHGRFSEPAATSRPVLARFPRLDRSIPARPHCRRDGTGVAGRATRGRLGLADRKATLPGAFGALDPPINRMLQVCNSVNAMRAFFGLAAAQVLGPPGEKTSHKSFRGRHCAGPPGGRGSAEGVSRPAAGLVHMTERAVPGRRPAVCRVGSGDGRSGLGRLGPRPGSIRPAHPMLIIRPRPHPARHRFGPSALPAAAGPVGSGRCGCAGPVTDRGPRTEGAGSLTVAEISAFPPWPFQLPAAPDPGRAAP